MLHINQIEFTCFNNDVGLICSGTFEMFLTIILIVCLCLGSQRPQLQYLLGSYLLDHKVNLPEM